MNNASSTLTTGWHVFGGNADLQMPFDVAVVMPTIGRDSILDAVASVYAQENVRRIQLLIGVDAPLGEFARLEELLDAAPAHVTPCLFYPGYSTSARHGGMHPSRDGGALRTTLSYLANARHIAYLDDDNWWAPDHLRGLLGAIKGRDWAFALRWFVHPESLQPVCVDDWESVGPGRGDFAGKFGGWVDPNCLMIDKLACEPALRLWSNPPPGDMSFLLSDRRVYDWLQRKSAPGESRTASVFYMMQSLDGNHPFRVARMGPLYEDAGRSMKPRSPRLTAIITCKGRLHHLKQTLPLLAAQALIEVTVVDYACPDGTAVWVRENFPRVKVIEVTDDPDFCLARARNIGLKAANTPWLLFIDADVMIGEGLSDWVENNLKPGGLYLNSKFGSELSGTFFCPRVAAERVDGYDESIRGWGGEDEDIYTRLMKSGLQRRNYPDTLFSAIHHSDEERFPCWGTDRRIQMLVNHWYLAMKYDLMAAWDRRLSLDERVSLRKLASEAAQQSLLTNGVRTTELFLDLGERTETARSTAWVVKRRLLYECAVRRSARDGVAGHEVNVNETNP